MIPKVNEQAVVDRLDIYKLTSVTVLWQTDSKVPW